MSDLGMPERRRTTREKWSPDTCASVACWVVTTSLLADGRVWSTLARMNPVSKQMAFLCLPERRWEGYPHDEIRYHIAEAALDARLDLEALRMGW